MQIGKVEGGSDTPCEKETSSRDRFGMELKWTRGRPREDREFGQVWRGRGGGRG